MGLAAIISNCEMFKLNVKKGYCFAGEINKLNFALEMVWSS
jgi:hypothetical protein